MKISEIKIINRYFPKCPWCGSEEDLELEHYIPKSQGGKNELGNIYNCCQKCNRGVLGKFDKDPLKWAIIRFGYKKAIKIILSIKRKLNETRREDNDNSLG